MIRPCCGCKATGHSGARVRRIPGAFSAALLLVLAACGSKDGEPANDAGSATSAASAGARAGEEPVTAWVQSAGTPLATLQFLLSERPVVGQPFTLQLSATVTQPVPVLQLQAQSSDLAVDPQQAELALGDTGRIGEQALTLTAEQPGLAELIVRLSANDAGAETVYAIPVLVAEAP